MRRRIAATGMLALLAGGCATTHSQVGDGVFTCYTGRTMKVREDGARRIVTLDDGPEIVLAPMPERRKGWWETGDYAMRISNDRVDWMVRDGPQYRRDWCRRNAPPA